MHKQEPLTDADTYSTEPVLDLLTVTIMCNVTHNWTWVDSMQQAVCRYGCLCSAGCEMCIKRSCLYIVVSGRLAFSKSENNFYSDPFLLNVMYSGFLGIYIFQTRVKFVFMTAYNKNIGVKRRNIYFK